MAHFYGDYHVNSGVISKTEKASYGDVETSVIYDPQLHSDQILVGFLNQVLEEGKKLRSKEIKALIG